MYINFLFFEDFETLDIFGPIEILSKIDNAQLNFISLQGGFIKSVQGYEVQTTSISTINRKCVLVIPGGLGTRSLINNDRFISVIKTLCQAAEFVLSICTGSAY